MWSKTLTNKNGFTLVEIIVVLIILAILAAFTIPTYLGYVKNSKVLMDESTVGLLNRTTQAYRISHHQSDPDSDPFNKDSETSENLLDLLVDGDYLSATDVSPKAEGAEFKWTHGVIGVGTWSLADASKGKDEYASEAEAEAAGFEFKPNSDGGYTIIGYDASMGLDVIIPSKIGDKPVTHIGDGSTNFSSFANKGLTSVTIPDTVRFISKNAFKDNALTSLVIPSSVKLIIGDYAFAENQLTKVTIPDSVTNIGSFAFSNNKLTLVTILGKPQPIHPNAFANNGATNSINTEEAPGVFELIDNKWKKQPD